MKGGGRLEPLFPDAGSAIPDDVTFDFNDGRLQIAFKSSAIAKSGSIANHNGPYDFAPARHGVTFNDAFDSGAAPNDQFARASQTAANRAVESRLSENSDLTFKETLTGDQRDSVAIPV